jgi:hypothetical protein
MNTFDKKIINIELLHGCELEVGQCSYVKSDNDRLNPVGLK